MNYVYYTKKIYEVDNPGIVDDIGHCGNAVRNIDVCQKICAGRMDGMNSNKNTPFKSCNVFIFESLSTDVHDQVWTVGHCTGEVEWRLVRK